jgi:carboxymethylenebutenolidase
LFLAACRGGTHLRQFKERSMAISQPDGYLAVPPNGQGRGVLVLHAWWGLNETVRAYAARLAEQGFVVFAPDLYAGDTADTISDAELLAGFAFGHLDETSAVVAAAAQFLYERTGQPLAVVGFSLGAFFALDLSTTQPDLIQDVVVYYGTRFGDYGASRAAYLGHFAESDDFEPQSEVEGLEAALRQADRPVEFHTYPGTGHWFAEPDRLDAYDPAAADLAWQRTLAFLQHTATL